MHTVREVNIEVDSITDSDDPLTVPDPNLIKVEACNETYIWGMIIIGSVL